MMNQIIGILADLLDLEKGAIRPESYLVRDLGMESIDFLELAVSLNEQFKIPVEDDTLLLRNLRLHLAAADEAGAAPLQYLAERYLFLPRERLEEILDDLEGGPVIQARDLESYVQWQLTQ